MEFSNKCDSYHRTIINQDYTDRWISLRSDLFGTGIIAAATLFGCLAKSFSYLEDPSLIGLSINWALNVF